jgi:hypothetical protein
MLVLKAFGVNLGDSIDIGWLGLAVMVAAFMVGPIRPIATYVSRKE